MGSKSKGFWGCLAGGCLLLVLLVFVGAVLAWLYYFRGAQDQRKDAPVSSVEEPLDDIQADEVRLPDENGLSAESPEAGGQPLIPSGPANPPGQPVPFTPAKMQAAIDGILEWVEVKDDPVRMEALARRQGLSAAYELSAYCSVALAVGTQIRAGDLETVKQRYARIYPPEVVEVIARPENLEKIGRLVPSE